MQKLLAYIALMAISFGAHTEDASTVIKIQKSTEGAVSCSIRSSGERMEYVASARQVEQLQKNRVLRCFSKALKSPAEIALLPEEPIVAQISSEVPGLRCYRNSMFFLKFRDEIPDDFERLMHICYERARKENGQPSLGGRWV